MAGSVTSADRPFAFLETDVRRRFAALPEGLPENHKRAMSDPVYAALLRSFRGRPGLGRCLRFFCASFKANSIQSLDRACARWRTTTSFTLTPAASHV